MSGAELEAAPTSAPYQCVGCTRAMPSDGPFVRLEGRNTFGDIWVCAVCSEHILSAFRLMSLKLYEQRVSDLNVQMAVERDQLEAERARLVEVERSERDAAHARAIEAQAEVERLRSQAADLERSLREALARAEAAEAGSFAVQALEQRFDRLEEVVARNAGAEGGTPKARARQAAEAA